MGNGQKPVQNENVQWLKEQIAKLQEERDKLNRSCISYKSQNTVLRNEVKKWKGLDYEGDTVVEDKCAIIDAQRAHIESLTKQIESLQKCQTPWYKRIFKK